MTSWATVFLLCQNETQRRYEAIRPILLESQAVKSRSIETQLHIQTLRRYVKDFQHQGFDGLLTQKDRDKKKKSSLPDEIKYDIVHLKSNAPEVGQRELIRYLKKQHQCKLHHSTLRIFLQSDEFEIWLKAYQYLKPKKTEMSLYETNVETVKLRKKGLNLKTIASLIDKSKTTVERTLNKFKENKDFKSLEHGSVGQSKPRKSTFPAMVKTLKKQIKYPHLGPFRIKGLLENDDVKLSQSTVEKLMKANREAYPKLNPPQEKGVVKYLPFRPQYRHHYWFIDIRYLVKIEGNQIYSICIIEGYSRKVLSGDVFERQYLPSILKVLRQALKDYGLPDNIISDNAKVFRSPRLKGIMIYLGIKWDHIESGKPWQNLIEAMYSIQKRMFDFIANKTPSFEQLAVNHRRDFVDMYNKTSHWAHVQSKRKSTSPDGVLSWVKGREVSEAKLDYAFKHTLIGRVLTIQGYTRIHNFYLFTARGLRNKSVTVVLEEKQLKIESEGQVFAEYDCELTASQQLKKVSNPRIYEIEIAEQQLSMFKVEDDNWEIFFRKKRKTYERKSSNTNPNQLCIPFEEDDLAV